jgi:hypothetical protein
LPSSRFGNVNQLKEKHIFAVDEPIKKYITFVCPASDFQPFNGPVGAV